MKSVVIVGVAAVSFQWTTEDIWAINHAGLMYDNSAWFHLHGPAHVLQAYRGADSVHAMAQKAASGGRVVVANRTLWVDALTGLDGVTMFEDFPFSRVEERFGSYQTSSFPLLIDLAVMEGYERIVLDGVQYGPDRPGERWAIPCINYHIGLARALGADVQVHPGAHILDCSHVYGKEGPGSI